MKKTELDKLQEYLISRRISHERIDERNRHQICVPEDGLYCRWDVICHRGSYGYEEGLLEIYGDIVDWRKDGDSVVGWLTAEDVIRRVEGLYASKGNRNRSNC